MTKQDPIEMLLEDHKKVQTLFSNFNKSKDEAARQDIVNLESLGREMADYKQELITVHKEANDAECRPNWKCKP
jgi:hypothetical protein